METPPGPRPLDAPAPPRPLPALPALADDAASPAAAQRALLNLAQQRPGPAQFAASTHCSSDNAGREDRECDAGTATRSGGGGSTATTSACTATSRRRRGIARDGAPASTSSLPRSTLDSDAAACRSPASRRQRPEQRAAGDADCRCRHPDMPSITRHPYPSGPIAGLALAQQGGEAGLGRSLHARCSASANARSWAQLCASVVNGPPRRGCSRRSRSADAVRRSSARLADARRTSDHA
jgi:hypothetical protein